jgi:alanine racemase
VSIAAKLAQAESMKMRPTWAEISLSALQHNFALIRDHVAPQADVCAVVKCNAYGHGAAMCAQALQRAGAKWFGVTCAQEAIELRTAGITGRILLMSGFWSGEEEAILQHQLTPVVWDWKHIELLENAAQRLALPAASISVHLKVETGMARLGVSIAQLPEMIRLLRSAKYIQVEGVLSHFASAEILDAPDVDAQLSRFDDAVSAIIEAGLSPSYFHIANSAAIIARQKSWKNLVRPGISLYGYYLPFKLSANAELAPELAVKPVLCWKTRVMALRDVDAHQPVGYNGAYVTKAPARLAVLPIGYGDGLNRQLSSKGRVLVRGEFANMVGNVSMDQTLIDVTGLPGVEVGDEVVVIGTQGKKSISAWEHARLALTIPYEILCNISARVPRLLVD